MSDALIRRLEIFAELSSADKAILAEATATSRPISARTDVSREGDARRDVFVLLSGIGCRYKIVAEGRRCIVAFVLPGDLCDIHAPILNRMDHTLATLSPCEMSVMPRSIVSHILEHHPMIVRALACSSMATESIQHEWLANLGGRNSPMRIGHLLCELYHRMEAVDLVERGQFSLPITQIDLADATGQTSVHVNRSIQRLRSERLITFAQGMLGILDLRRLERISDFQPDYLQLSRQVGTTSPD